MIRKILEPKNTYLSYYNLNKTTSILLFNIFNELFILLIQGLFPSSNKYILVHPQSF
jgi:hypothetical protein